jgi:hypothetical protein
MISFVSFIKEMDIDKDGQLSREELLQGVEKHFIGRDENTAPRMLLSIYLFIFCAFSPPS